MKPIDPDFVPSTIEEAVSHILVRLTDEDRAQLMEDGPDGYSGIGKYLQKAWSLGTDTPLMSHFRQRYALWGDPADASNMVFQAIYKHLTDGMGITAACEDYADRLKISYAAMGIDPHTGERIIMAENPGPIRGADAAANATILDN